MNYRFWKTVNGSPVKITVPEGETIRFTDDWRNDHDGSSLFRYVITHTPEGVEVITTHEGYCVTDGAYGWGSENLIPKGFLATNRHNGVLWPTYVWTGTRRGLRGLFCPVKHMGENEEW
jgi:hypothetical protein|tara:strand:- start:1513 stop:1869 length:357 start_codon:yes stop_codon:yes gene_type:complete